MVARELWVINDRLMEIIDRDRNTPVIDPGSIAEEVVKELDPNGVSPLLIRLVSTIAIRQLARRLLRNKFDPVRRKIEAPDSLFPELQWRYPVAKGTSNRKGYVLLGEMTKQDHDYNVKRMRKASRGLSIHADRLEAHGKMHTLEEEA